MCITTLFLVIVLFLVIWCFRWWLQPFRGVPQFSWVSSIHTGSTHVIRLFSPVNLSCVTGMSQLRTQKDRENYFSSPQSSSLGVQ